MRLSSLPCGVLDELDVALALRFGLASAGVEKYLFLIGSYVSPGRSPRGPLMVAIETEDEVKAGQVNGVWFNTPRDGPDNSNDRK
jgi:hypothetical protein